MTPSNAQVSAAMESARKVADCPACEGRGTEPKCSWVECRKCKGTGSAWADTDRECITARLMAIASLMSRDPKSITDRELVDLWESAWPMIDGEPCEWAALLYAEVRRRMNGGEIDRHLEALEAERNAPSGRNEPDGSEYQEAE